jgi:hypothetical protein
MCKYMSICNETGRKKAKQRLETVSSPVVGSVEPQ